MVLCQTGTEVTVPSEPPVVRAELEYVDVMLGYG